MCFQPRATAGPNSNGNGKSAKSMYPQLSKGGAPKQQLNILKQGPLQKKGRGVFGMIFVYMYFVCDIDKF